MYIDLVKYKSMPRDYFARMNPEKPEVMKIAKEYGKDFWDGDRKYGYGGYSYDGRWKSVAERIVKQYDLKDYYRILDIGCGKGYLLYELKQINPTFQVYGLEQSRYAIDNAKPEVKDRIEWGIAERLPWTQNYMDMVISLGTLYNLPIYDLKDAIQEIERVGKLNRKYITMESFRNDKERINLFCWALTAESYFSNKEWEWLLKEFGYTGDYSLFFFE